MAEGKFSHPRNNREEERQIEQAFRQITGQTHTPSSTYNPLTPQDEESDLDYLFTETEEPNAELPPIHSEAFAEEDPPQPPESFDDFLDRAIDFFTRYRQQVLLGLSAAAALLVVIVIAVIFIGSSDPYDGKILSNVYLGDINVGGMTKAQASSALKSAEVAYASTDMVAVIGSQELRFTPSDTKIKLKTKEAVNAAYAYGRTGTKQQQQQALELSQSEKHTIGLLSYLSLDADLIRSSLESFAASSGSTLTQTSYGLEGIAPDLHADKFDPTAPGQALVITMGTPGTGFDANTVFNQILDAYSLLSFRVEAASVETITEPDPIDLEAIYKEFYIEPVDASIDPKTFEPIPGVYGCRFDVEKARELTANAKPGEVIRIPMEYVEPAITDKDVLYHDVLGECQTKHTSNANRNTNLRLACEALNGLVLNPGETFSYNDALGQRTAAKGYKPAPAYVGQELVDDIGGGICQVSSTLYYAALVADMEIVSRTNHGFVSSYIPYGMDATVSWGGPDFKFRNSSNYPVKIEAYVADGYVHVAILGTDQRDYYVKLEYKITGTQEPDTKYIEMEADNPDGLQDGDVIDQGVTGYTVKTYKVKYSIVNNAVISRDFITTSQYLTKPRQVVQIKPEPTTTPTTEATVPPTTQATVPPTTQETVPPTTQETVPSTTQETVAPPAAANTVPPENGQSGEGSPEGSQNDDSPA